MYGTFVNDYNDISRRYDYESNKITSYIESAFKTFNINKTEAELKVYRESGTSEDLAYLTEAASNGLVDAIKNALRAIKEKFLKFINTVKTKVSEKITGAEARKAIKDAEKKIKENPMIGKVTVSYTPYSSTEKLINKYKDKCDKDVAKLKGLKTLAGQEISDIGPLMQDIANFKNEFSSLKENLTAKNAAKAITISALIALLISDIKNLDKKISDEAKDADKITQVLSSSIDSEADASVKAAYIQAMNFRTDLSKKQVDGYIADIMNKKNSLKRGISDAIISLKGNVENKEVKESSALDDILSEDDELMTEGANLQIRRKMIDSNKEVRENFKKIKKLLKNGDFKESKKLVKNNKVIIERTIKDIQSIDSSFGSLAFSLFTGLYPLWRKTFIGALGVKFTQKGNKIKFHMNDSKLLGVLPVFLLSKTYYQYLESSVGMLEQIDNDGPITKDTFNRYKTNSIRVMKSFSGICDGIEKAISDYEKELKKTIVKKESVDEFDDPYGFDDIDDLY